MSSTIAIINQKGGVGKSTTASAISSGLTSRGFKVLAVDLDPQCDLSNTFNSDKKTPTSFALLSGEISAKDAIKKTTYGDIINSSSSLSGADGFITDTGKEYKLKEGLACTCDDYDFIIIDTPPALGILTVNALTASNFVVIPAQADIFSMNGVNRLYETIKTVKKYCNPSLVILGVLLTRYNARAVISREIKEVVESLAEQMGTKLFKHKIREAIAIKESQIKQQSIYEYAKNASVTSDYNSFLDELLEDMKQHD